MILRDLQQFVTTHQPVSLPDLSAHFQVAPEVIEPMLLMLVRKGRLGVNAAQSTCGQCQQCSHSQQSTAITYFSQCTL